MLTGVPFVLSFEHLVTPEFDSPYVALKLILRQFMQPLLEVLPGYCFGSSMAA